MNREEIKQEIESFQNSAASYRESAERVEKSADEFSKQLAALDEIQPGTWCKFWDKKNANYSVGTLGRLQPGLPNPYTCRESGHQYRNCEPYPEPDVLAEGWWDPRDSSLTIHGHANVRSEIPISITRRKEQ